MSNIIPFHYEANEIRVLQDGNNEPWWVAKDVCAALNIYDVSQAVERLDHDEKLLRTLHVSGQNRDIWTVSEPGLYTLIIRSNKQDVKKFKRWITHDVLPSIRKTGAYIQSSNPTLVFLQTEAESAKRLAQTFGLKGNQALLSANHAMKELHNVDCLKLIGNVQLIADDNELHITPTEIGENTGFSAKKANILLKERGLQVDYRDHKKRIRWEPTEKGMPYAIFKDTGKKHSDGTPVQQLFWKKSVLKVLI